MTLKNKVSLEYLRDSLNQIKFDKTRVMIAIDGPSGSGKSYFARQLSNVLTNSFIVEMDDFISWNSLDLGVERAINQLFEPLLKEGKTKYQARDWVGDYFGDRLGKWKVVPMSDYIIFEGISSSRIKYSKYLNISVWVDAPEELCIKRGLDRDGDESIKHWKSFKQIEKDFFRKDKTKERADYIVSGVNGDIIRS